MRGGGGRGGAGGGGGSTGGGPLTWIVRTLAVCVVLLLCVELSLMVAHHQEHPGTAAQQQQQQQQQQQLKQQLPLAGKGSHAREQLPRIRGAGNAQTSALLGGARGSGGADTAPAAPVLRPTSRPAVPAVPRKRRVAYAITITNDGPYFDGAAVLAYSVRKVTEQSKEFDADLVAFVHPEVRQRKGLELLGFKVLEKPVPVNVSEIRGERVRERITKNGCCGERELLKLHSYTLTEYHRVVHLDMDCVFLQSIDELLDLNASLVYTTDPNMRTKSSSTDPVQGGFMVVRPDMRVFQDFVDIVLEGDFRAGSGWGGKHIGWFWGGMTIQGLLPYYYAHKARPSDNAVEVNRCEYNTMVDTPECRAYTPDRVKTGHFTICQKPWICFKAHKHRLCGELHQKWFELRKEAEAEMKLPVVENACPHGGKKHYVPLQLSAELRAEVGGSTSDVALPKP